MATPIKWGNEFSVNAFTTDNQYQSHITALADGRYVVTWTDLSKTLGDSVGDAIHGQIFAADGTKLGVEFLVNSSTTDDEFDPIIVPLADGGFAASWMIQDGSTEIIGQVFKPDGTKLFGSSFLIANGATLDSMAALANDPDGRFVVTWRNANGDIRAQIYNPDTSTWGGKIDVNTQTAGDQHDSSVTALSNDRFVVTWTSVDAGVERVHGQLFTNDGSNVANEFIVSSQGSAGASQVTALDNGRFVVAWEHLSGDGTKDIDAQIFNADGTKSGVEFLVNTTTAGHQYTPVIATLHDGRFVAAWADGEIHAQVFNADGTKSGAEFLVNTQTVGDQGDPSITVLADGRFAVTWTSPDGNGNGIHEQIFDPRESGMNINGTTLNDDLIGTKFNDVMKGAGGDDRLYGDAGDDLFIGSLGADTLSGGPGSDTASYVDSGSSVLVNLASNINTGGEAQGDILYSIDNLIGSKYDDYLTGNGLDNVLEGGGGADTLNGGFGTDTASYQTSSSYVIVNLDSGFGAHGDAQGDKLSNIENLIGSKYDDILSGNTGANVIEGGLGNDQIFGADGDDTAVFSHNFNDYTVIDYGLKILVIGPDGTDTLSSIEHLRFADATITPFDDGNPLFDTLYYLSRNGDVFHAGVNALDHFNSNGWHEGRDPNPYFDTSGYLAVNKDVAASGQNPLDHYHQIGWHEGRDPSADFDTTLYLLHNPDVAGLGIDPLAHYLQSGFTEGRQIYAAIGTAVNGFDAEYYLLHNPDVAAAGIDPLAHFNANGWHEGRNPNAWFDTAGYLAHYGDVAAAGINPLQHYEQFGWLEGRDPSAGFDTLKYLAANPDVAAAHINPLDHFINNGIYEGRAAINDGLWH